MSDIEAKIEEVNRRFRKGSKQNEAARYIVRKNREIPADERKAICEQIPIAESTLRDLFTELRKMGVYPPEKTSEISYIPPTLEKPEETSHHVPEAPQPPLQEYATKEDFETLRNSINNLAALFNEEPSPNPGEDEDKEEEERIELIQPGELIIQDGSSTRESLYIKPKTRMYYDMSKQGAFHNYPGTRELGPFANFNGSMSDFFNKVVNDYFIRLYNADIGLTMRMPVK